MSDSDPEDGLATLRQVEQIVKAAARDLPPMDGGDVPSVEVQVSAVLDRAWPGALNEQAWRGVPRAMFSSASSREDPLSSFGNERRAVAGNPSRMRRIAYLALRSMGRSFFQG